MSHHPLHPALVHFPIACWSLATMTDLAGLWFGKIAWRWSAGLLAVGCVMALLAMAAGLMELARVPEGEPMRDAYVHMGAMALALALFGARLMWGLDGAHPLAPDAVSLILDAGGFAALVAGGWFGARLVYLHGVGRVR
ncbi:DUF2231 domain-containing protein [Allopusillimonas soli]|nr:DUF2231 domain-containing protein [Allopusillimonas soli]TEA75305.1 DUF2231 domain-containing protein [Allopusillimonas soli]